MPTELLEPVVNDGVRLTHFFNGRVLTAEDLRREQDAARDRHRGLAGAVGEGVVRGLEVTPLRRDLPAPTVRITAGLAFNRDGDPVELPRDVELRLIPAQAETDQEAGLFALCERVSATSSITNPGFYVLARYTRDDFKDYRRNLRIFQREVRASGKNVGIMDLDIGTRTKVGVVYNDDDFTMIIQMMGEAIRYAYDTPIQAAQYAGNN